MQEEIIKRIKEIQKEDYLPLYGDLQFKYIYGTTENIKFTIKLLELLLKVEKGLLNGSKIKSEVKLNRKTVSSKSFELDILVELPDGSITNLEMQQELDKEAEIKNTLYVSKIFSGIVKKGKDYITAKKVSQLEFIKENKQHNNEDIINRYHISNDKNPSDKILEDLFEIITVDIEKTNNQVYNEDVDEELERMLKVIKATTLESALEGAGNNLLLLEMIEKMVRFNEEDFVQDYSRQQALIDSRRNRDVKIAREEGKKEGHKEEKYEIAKNLLKNTNMSVEQISLNIGLTKEEIETLKENL